MRRLTTDFKIFLLHRSMYNNSAGTYAPFENDENYFLTNSKSEVGSNDDLG